MQKTFSIRSLISFWTAFWLLSFLAFSCKKEPKQEITNNHTPIVLTYPYAIQTVGTSVKMGGIILHNGGYPVLREGLCWSLDSNPRIELVGDKLTNEGADPEQFESVITNLNPDTSYIVRAYVVNAGNHVGYGQRVRVKVFAPKVTLSQRLPQFFPFEEETIIRYDTAFFDGGAKSSMAGPKNGPFTYILAPTSGMYNLSMSVFLADQSNFTIFLKVNQTIAWTNVAIGDKCATAASLYLNQGDTVRAGILNLPGSDTMVSNPPMGINLIMRLQSAH